MTRGQLFRTLALALTVGVATFAAGAASMLWLHRSPPTARFSPPSGESIPAGPFGAEVARGRAIFTDTGAEAPQFVGNALKCSNCHLDAGRKPDSAPLWAAYVLFPQYRAKNAHVNTFQERLQGCFRYSMNGKAPPLGDPVLVALESYAAYLARGAPVGAKLPGQGYPKLGRPASPPDYVRGQDVYQAQCALCHGNDGAGQGSGGATVFPPLWGEHAYNWGAGMADINNAAGFIKANMPLSRGGTLSDQLAWDVAAYIDSKPRPQDPRYLGSLEATRAKFHNTPQSMYGRTVNGILLGGDEPPKPFAGPAVAAGS